MPTFDLPGGWTTSPNQVISNYGNIPRTLTQGSITIPAGRTMLNSSQQILITHWRLMLAGYGAGNTNIVSCTLNGVGAANHSIAGANQAQDTSDRAFTAGLVSPGAGSLVITFNDRIYFGRQNSGPSPVGGNGSAVWGAMVGRITYSEAPSAPGAPVCTVSGSLMSMTWNPPGSDGGSAVNGYRIQVSSSSNFTTGVLTYDIPVAPSFGVGLSPGDYWVRIAAKNAVTAAVGTTSVWSAVTAFKINAGVQVKVAGTYQYAVPYVKVGGVYTQVTPYVKVAGNYVPTV